MTEVKKTIEEKKRNLPLNLSIHDWMIKAHGNELYFAGREQLELDF